MMDCQYVATQRGGVALVFEGHRYNKVRDGKDGTVYWRCSRDRQCPGRAVTVHSRIKKANNKHNHNPDGCNKANTVLLGSMQLQQQLNALNGLRMINHNGNVANTSLPASACPANATVHAINGRCLINNGSTNPNSSSNGLGSSHSLSGSFLHNENLTTRSDSPNKRRFISSSPLINAGFTDISSIAADCNGGRFSSTTIQDSVASPSSFSPNSTPLDQLLYLPGLLGETLRVLSLARQSPLGELLANRLLSASLEDLNHNSMATGNEIVAHGSTSGRHSPMSADYYSDSDEEQPLDMAVQSQDQLLKKLRQLMKNGGSTDAAGEPIHAYIVPSSDAHHSEYPAKCDKRRAFLSGFTGSAGTAVVTLNGQQLLWTDGRYFDQALKELPAGWTLQRERLSGTPTIAEWLLKHLPNGVRVGVDPFVMSQQQFLDLQTKLSSGTTNQLQLVPLSTNLVDHLWTERPQRPAQPIRPLPISFTGRSWQDKLSELQKQMRSKQAQFLLLSALDEIAWLLNLRGNDIEFNPVFFAYAVITEQYLVLFVNESQLTSEARSHLLLDLQAGSGKDTTDSVVKINSNGNGSPVSSEPSSTSGERSATVIVQVKAYSLIAEYLRWLVGNSTGKLWLPAYSTSYALSSLVPDQRRIQSASPVALAKAMKNPVEIEGMRSAQLKDSVALCEFFAWLEEQVPKGGVTELSAAAKLLQFRSQQTNFVQPSFECISASGPNAAIIHYRPSETSDRVLSDQEIYLVDSGAQYLNGTTDVTRTVHLGQPTAFEREAFTRVLKGHIALASSIFPAGVKGHCLDSHARRALWAAGLNYLHGTGHGVGSFLNVHEGPMGIGMLPMSSDPGLAEGMILSNEPGYYESGKFGIRIESLMLIRTKQTKYSFNNDTYLCFDTITLVPIQTKMLEPSLLTAEEVEWLEQYHQTCREVVGNELKQQGKMAAYHWLMKETQPIG